MLNHIAIMGRLGRDPEVRYTQSGTPVASFSLAVDRDFTDQSTGHRGTDWIDVVAWSNRATFVERYFRKGQLAVVEGRLQIRDYTARDGSRRRAAEVIAASIYFAGGKSQESEGNAAEDSLPESREAPMGEAADDGELPF